MEERLAKAIQLQKYGHLETWREIFLFQAHMLSKKNIGKVKEIAAWAKRKNQGEQVTLPLMLYGNQETFL